MIGNVYDCADMPPFLRSVQHVAMSWMRWQAAGAGLLPLCIRIADDRISFQ